MRILNQAAGKPLTTVTLYLTRAEASELRDSLEQLLVDPLGRHEHISSSDHAQEITVCIYDPDNLDEFDERSRKLIMEGL